MSDVLALIFVVGMTLVLTAALAQGFSRRHPLWSRRRIMMVSALPVPALVMLPGLLLIGHALYIGAVDPESCGVDACGMAMFLGSIVVVVSLLLFGLALVIGYFATLRQAKVDISETFQ